MVGSEPSFRLKLDAILVVDTNRFNAGFITRKDLIV